MSLKITRVVVHHLEKEEQSTKASIEYSEHLLKIDAFAKQLILELHNSISDSSSKKNATFKENESNSFKDDLLKYLDDSSDDRFIQFSYSLEILRQKIQKQNFAKGGYFLFCDYSVDSKHFVMVVLLRKRSGINIIRKEDNYILDKTENVNIEKTAMAARLNFTIFKSEFDDRKYLSIITTQADGNVSGYFKEWILADGLIKNSENTQHLINLLKTIDPPLDEKGDSIDQLEFQKRVHDYVKTEHKGKVNIYDISSHFYGETLSSKIKDYAETSGVVIDPEFKVSGQHWKKLITIRAKVPGIELRVDLDKLNSSNVDVKSDRIIIYSDKLPSIIKREKQVLIENA
ncbi:nucleoid-associated protein [Aquimarina agarilytica]|uniref:nucleoid-associated protein n=1 Tax=Aquimarina agarilytica TaxID=1087449 RepID=UPI00028A0D72|nr:nucleoid-associated protein [Aquimarina agarilytica]